MEEAMELRQQLPELVRNKNDHMNRMSSTQPTGFATLAADISGAVASSTTYIAKWIYWIVGILFLGAVSYFLFNTLDRQIASVLVFIGGVLALYYYYVKWFLTGAGKKWPPYQTMCPDYLTPISPGYDATRGASGNMVNAPKAGGVFKCVDFVGVSRNGRLKKIKPNEVQKALQSDSTSFPINPRESQQALKARLNTYGLSWISLFGNSQ